jgi:hypothetical protein
MDKKKIIDIRTIARPVKFRTQDEIIAERRKKRKEKFEAVKRDIRNLYNPK